MKINKTSIEGLYLIEPIIHKDRRGYFMESYKSSIIKTISPNIKFIQENESMSSFGVLRGLHYQNIPYQQTKLVRVIKGKVLDVVVDLRPKSPSYGKHESFILSSKNKNQLYIPKGFAHGFLVLSKKAIFNYKVDNIYNQKSESGIIYNDKTLNIDWKLNNDEMIISSKDLSLPNFNNIKSKINS